MNKTRHDRRDIAVSDDLAETPLGLFRKHGPDLGEDIKYGRIVLLADGKFRRHVKLTEIADIKMRDAESFIRQATA